MLNFYVEQCCSYMLYRHLLYMKPIPGLKVSLPFLVVFLLYLVMW